MNPSYYELEDSSTEGVEAHLTAMVEGVLSDLVKAHCIQYADGFLVFPTALGLISSQYYLYYKTVGLFKSCLDDWKDILIEGHIQARGGLRIADRQEGSSPLDGNDDDDNNDEGGSRAGEDMSSNGDGSGNGNGSRSRGGRGRSSRGRNSNTDPSRDSGRGPSSKGAGKEPSGSMLLSERIQSSGLSQQRMIRLLCQAYEFAELPVRHNEEHLNADLASDLPWKSGQSVKGLFYVMFSPHSLHYIAFSTALFVSMYCAK